MAEPARPLPSALRPDDPEGTMSEAPPSSRMIGTVLSSRYRLDAKLGSGGMSTVYLARDEILDRPVAVKLMHDSMASEPDQLERFNQEARAVAKLSNPNVVAVIDAGEDDGRPYIVFEYVEGETLKQLISRVGALETTEALAYGFEISQALEVAHVRGMVHRDVKPQNVLIDSTGQAKLTDFGISRQLDEEGMTAEGKVVGTTDYVAPEQAMGHEVDTRADIYALGVVLFEMLTGDVPFKAANQVGVAMKHVTEDLPDLQQIRPDLSATTAAVVERATAKEPADRYGSTAEMTADLQTALEVEAIRSGGAGSEATSILDAVPAPARQLPDRRTSPWPAAILLLVALVVAAGSAWLISQGGTGGGGGGAGSGDKVEVASVTDFDPEGDGVEHPEEVEFAIDGDPNASAWTTETYQTDSFGTKSGVGLVVDLGSPRKLSSVQVVTPTPGWPIEVYGANDPLPDSLDGWEALGSADSVSDRDTIDLITLTSYRYLLLWATAPAETDDGYGVAISDVSVFE
ncbi:MAG: protein kinase domain-containing protein [Solirubrobacterales bacterium]